MTEYRRIFEENRFIFITVVTYNRRPVLIENIELLRQAFKHVQKYNRYEIFGIVILPDHFHMLIKPDKINEYPQIVSSIKYYFSKNIDYMDKETLPISKIKKREKGIWQRRYWEHTIRDEKDLYKHLDYIHYNPVKHDFVNNVKDWEYSSFHKFIKQEWYEENWGCNDDIKHIKDIEFE